MNRTDADPWHRLGEHRERAAKYPLRILVWGPGEDESASYRARCEARDRLNAEGHHATFSEDLCAQKHSLANPLYDEVLQAEVADAIVVFYGSRGSQTEHDVILSRPQVLAKCLVIVEKQVFDRINSKSIASVTWATTVRHAQVLSYEDEVGMVECVNRAIAMLQDSRQAAYVRDLQAGRV